MTDILRQYERNMEELSHKEAEGNRIKGKIEQLNKELKELGFDDLESAQEWLVESEDKLTGINSQLEKDLIQAEGIIDGIDIR